MTKTENVSKASIAYLNGFRPSVCHWWSRKFAINRLEKQVLVSFNLSTETFRTTSIVWLQENDDSSTRTLVVLNESVTLISSFTKNSRIEISILGEVGVKKSWVKLFAFRFGPFPKYCAFRMGNKCDVIFYINGDELASFDVIPGKDDHPLETLNLFRRLVRTNFRSNGPTVATVLSACADIRSISIAQEMGNYISLNGLEYDLQI
ncbi:hypothetical protein Ahy_B05g074195 [Arachis hypogaea]|uniref:Uncharacterized protein n=1 Tax=Arachis hypogaea TaxID=3818 RepID=A0A444YY65_ARAHY|nr:hypothetical protein Ahy_B05g074195 [Arachis hypogaea]